MREGLHVAGNDGVLQENHLMSWMHRIVDVPNLPTPHGVYIDRGTLSQAG